MCAKRNKSVSGERDAVFSKSGLSVHPSDPGLKRPTLLVTAGRTPAARLREGQGAETRLALLQPKTGRGAGQSPADILDEDASADEALSLGDIQALVAFFRLLEGWKAASEASGRCRPCLIACNSRHGDEVRGLNDSLGGYGL